MVPALVFVCSLLLTWVAHAAEPTFIELPNTWRITDVDDPSFSSVDFDDSRWQEVELASTEAPTPSGPPHATVVWYRTQLDVVPLEAPAALTVGYVRGAYEVYVDGVHVGGRGSIASGEVDTHAPAVLAVPNELMSDRRLVVAVRTWLPPGQGRFVGRQRLSAGTRLVGPTPVIEREVERMSLSTFKRFSVHPLIIAIIELWLCFFHLILWRRRPELRIYAYYAMSAGMAALFDGLVFGYQSAAIDYVAAAHLREPALICALIATGEFICRFVSEAPPSRVWRTAKRLVCCSRSRISRSDRGLTSSCRYGPRRASHSRQAPPGWGG